MKRLDIGKWLHIYKPYAGYSLATHKHTAWSVRLQVFGWRFHNTLTIDPIPEAPKGKKFSGKSGWVVDTAAEGGARE